jgi:hypothetical protein
MVPRVKHLAQFIDFLGTRDLERPRPFSSSFVSIGPLLKSQTGLRVRTPRFRPANDRASFVQWNMYRALPRITAS